MSNLTTLLRTAKQFQQRGLWKQAIDAYGKVIDENPCFLGGYFGRQICFRREGRFRDARDDLDFILSVTEGIPFHEEQYPTLEFRADSFYERGEFHAEQEQWSTAFEFYHQSTKILLKLPENQRMAVKIITNSYKRGFLLSERLQKPEQALDEYSKGIRLAEDWMKKETQAPFLERFKKRRRTGYLKRAMVQESLHHFSEARTDFLKLGDMQGNYHIGRMYFREGDLENAQRHLLTALEIPHQRCVVSMHAADLLLRIKIARNIPEC